MFFIDPAYQRRGVGRKLLACALACCREHRSDVEQVTVNSSPNAVVAYRRFGFRSVGPLQVKNGIGFVPMTLELRQEKGVGDTDRACREVQMDPERMGPSPQAVGDAYIARPASGTGPGVLVLHAWWGLNPFFRGFCDRLAREGFLALAPDLYHGATASTIPEAERLRSKLKRETVSRQISETAERLRATSVSPQGIGAVGFSLGGYWALWLAEQGASPVAATIAFYGTRNGDYASSRSAFQFHLAERDAYVAASAVKKLQKQLKAAGREAEFHTYAGTSHWFFESDRSDAYDAQAAGLAWGRTIEFLKKHTMR